MPGKTTRKTTKGARRTPAKKAGAKRPATKKASAKKAAATRPAAPAKSGPTAAGAGAGDWRGATLAKVRALILAADPEIVEEVKWRKPSNPDGVPVWSRGGILCTGETYKSAVKLTFAQGARLNDPSKLFNAGLEGNQRRAIDLREGDELDARAFQELIRDAVAFNLAAPKGKR